jgi:hypothetical protein
MIALRLSFGATIAKEDATGTTAAALHVTPLSLGGIGEVIPGSGNEDCFAASEEHQLFALSDGASESYDSGLWSKLLCLQWIVGGGEASKASLYARIRDYTDACQPDALSWSKRAAFERGSYATFLGVRQRRGMVQVLSFGDSLAVWHQGERTVSFPYCRAEQFDERPLCLSTVATRNSPALDATRTSFTSWPMEPGSRLLLMTDALGRWLLSQSDVPQACKRLIEVSEIGEFARFVLHERQSGGMKRDDTTLAVLAVEVES